MIFWGMEQGIRYCKTPQRFLINCFRKEDIVGRLGGDEFVLLIRRIDG